MKTDRAIFLTQLARARGRIRSGEARPNQPRWIRRRDVILAAIESDLNVEATLNANLARHAASGLFAGGELAGQAMKANQDSQHQTFSVIFPWLRLKHPDEVRAEAQAEFARDAQQFHEALQNPETLRVLGEKTGMLQRMQQQAADQEQEQRRLIEVDENTKRLQAAIDERKAALDKRKKRRG